MLGMLGWMILSQGAKQSMAVHALDGETETSADALARLHENTSATNKLREDLTLMQARMDVLLDSITRLDTKLRDVQKLQQQVKEVTAARADQAHGNRETPVTASVSARQARAATGDEKQAVLATVEVTDIAATEVPSAGPLAAATQDGNKSATKTIRDNGTVATKTAAAGQKQTTAGDSGLWVINLVSFDDKRAADRFAKRARSKDVGVETVQTTVKGKPWWRVRVPGFATGEHARAAADSVEARLGLKESWVGRR
jgi:septal ring-binding cell division protein DamX